MDYIRKTFFLFLTISLAFCGKVTDEESGKDVSAVLNIPFPDEINRNNEETKPDVRREFNLNFGSAASNQTFFLGGIQFESREFGKQFFPLKQGPNSIRIQRGISYDMKMRLLFLRMDNSGLRVFMTDVDNGVNARDSKLFIQVPAFRRVEPILVYGRVKPRTEHDGLKVQIRSNDWFLYDLGNPSVMFGEAPLRPVEGVPGEWEYLVYTIPNGTIANTTGGQKIPFTQKFYVQISDKEGNKIFANDLQDQKVFNATAILPTINFTDAGIQYTTPFNESEELRRKITRFYTGDECPVMSIPEDMQVSCQNAVVQGGWKPAHPDSHCKTNLEAGSQKTTIDCISRVNLFKDHSVISSTNAVIIDKPLPPNSRVLNTVSLIKGGSNKSLELGLRDPFNTKRSILNNTDALDPVIIKNTIFSDNVRNYISNISQLIRIDGQTKGLLNIPPALTEQDATLMNQTIYYDSYHNNNYEAPQRVYGIENLYSQLKSGYLNFLSQLPLNPVVTLGSYGTNPLLITKGRFYTGNISDLQMYLFKENNEFDSAFPGLIFPFADTQRNITAYAMAHYRAGLAFIAGKNDDLKLYICEKPSDKLIECANTKFWTVVGNVSIPSQIKTNPLNLQTKYYISDNHLESAIVWSQNNSLSSSTNFIFFYSPSQNKWVLKTITLTHPIKGIAVSKTNLGEISVFSYAQNISPSLQNLILRYDYPANNGAVLINTISSSVNPIDIHNSSPHSFQFHDDYLIWIGTGSGNTRQLKTMSYSSYNTYSDSTTITTPNNVDILPNQDIQATSLNNNEIRFPIVAKRTDISPVRTTVLMCRIVKNNTSQTNCVIPNNAFEINWEGADRPMIVPLKNTAQRGWLIFIRSSQTSSYRASFIEMGACATSNHGDCGFQVQTVSSDIDNTKHAFMFRNPIGLLPKQNLLNILFQTKGLHIITGPTKAKSEGSSTVENRTDFPSTTMDLKTILLPIEWLGHTSQTPFVDVDYHIQPDDTFK